jgi:hypothetical protein
MWWLRDHRSTGMSWGWRVAIALPFVMAMACSWTHHVRLENTSDRQVEVAYKLSCPDRRCFFPDSAVVKPIRDRDPSEWTIHRINTADSTIRFTLPARHHADLATTWNRTYAYIHGNTGSSTPTDNLVWIRISSDRGTWQFNADGFLAASDTRRTGVTLFRIAELPDIGQR